MKITAVETTPLLLPFKVPYHWAKGVDRGTTVVLIEVHTDEGLTGVGESLPWQSVETVTSVYEAVADLVVGRDPHDVADIMRSLYATAATGNPSPRFFRQTFAGLEMAQWDVIGKAADLPVHKLFGGAVHQQVQYFAFLQGDTDEELAPTRVSSWPRVTRCFISRSAAAMTSICETPPPCARPSAIAACA